MGRLLGYTQVELLLTLCLLALATGLAMPMLTTFYTRQHLIHRVNDVIGILTLARSEAVRRNAPVYACPIRARSDLSYQGCRAGDDWSDGILLYADLPDGSPGRYDTGEAIARLIVHAPNTPQTTTIHGPTVLTFSADGRSALATDTALRVADRKRCHVIRLTPAGRALACRPDMQQPCAPCP